MNWKDINWQKLEDLRAPFLEGSKTKDYWRSISDLEHYDLTFAQRIGWKWNAVLAELHERDFALNADAHVVDWGCGSGIASRLFVESFGHQSISKISLWDRSKLAQTFAKDQLNAIYQLPVRLLEAGQIPGSDYILLLSHVLGELNAVDLAELNSWIEKAQTVIWVEPGTPALSAKLVAQRERWRETFNVVAPCGHQMQCGMLSGKNANNWCHFFAPPPPEVFSDSNWTKFGKTMKIDLRSLPTSFLVLDKATKAAEDKRKRVIGRPQLFNGYATCLGCSVEGVRECKLLKRDGKEQYRDFKDVKFTRFIDC